MSLSPIGAFARAHDPDRFLCALFAPAERREALFALIAFNHELARAREAASNPMAALIRLQWWRDALEEARLGRPARRHEVAAPLHDAVTGGALDAEALRGLGAAYGLAGVLRSVGAHAAQGRCLLPQDRLRTAGLDADAVIAEPAVAAALLREMAAEGLAALRAARRDVAPQARAAALPAVLAAADLRRIAAGRASGPRGIGDRLRVTWAGLTGLW